MKDVDELEQPGSKADGEEGGSILEGEVDKKSEKQSDN